MNQEVNKGLLRLWNQIKGEKKEKSAMEDSHRELHQSPLSPYLYSLFSFEFS
jgi:hypothetical protein